MRFAVFVFSILLIFSTTYAHAIAFVPAVVGGLVRTAGGQIMKVASKKGLLYTAGGAAIFTYCKKNQKKCKDVIGDTLGDYFFGDDDNNNHDAFYDECFYGGYRTKTPKKIINEMSKFHGKPPKRFERTLSDGSTDVYTFTYETNFGDRTDRIICRNNKTDEVAKKIAEHLSDDDIDQIINNYSKEIEINIDKYCATAGACAELEQSFGDEVMNNKNKYDIDKINKDNCEVRDGKITSCDKAKKDTDDDDSDTPKEPKKPDDGDDGDDGKDGDDDNDNSSNDKDDNKINCEASAFHKKVCDFIDWYQDDADLKDGDKVEIKELSNELKIDDDKVSFGRVCPDGKTVSIGFGNIKIVKQLSYQGLCDAFIKMKPFVVGVGWIVGAMIVVGRRV